MRLHEAYGFVFVLAALAFASCGDGQELSVDRIPLSIGETTVDLVVHRSQDAGLTYLNLHDDENTAVEATIAVLEERGGTLFELRHTGERNISFRLNDSTFTIDPNRIFTRRGIDASLSGHSESSPSAREAVRAFAQDLLDRVGFEELPLIATVHNNTDDRYSVLSYTDEGGTLSGDARFVHVSGETDRDDFYFVTSDDLYRALREMGENVVLQDNHLVEDDGSLSVLAGRLGIDYVNVEAEHGHVEKQREMIAALHDLVAGTESE